ncbi:MAG: T9SS type A sorting domain-containing protein [Saprospiraceae bacterium]|nr:T9SS type A sorting domain-containing protein [Saprospiraceae bacterium]
MKLTFTFTLLIFCYGIGNTQTQLPNADLEHWTTAVNGTDSLIGWSSSNAIVIPPVQSLYQEKNAWEGKFAANVVTAPFGFVGYSTVGVLVNGEATFSYGGGGGGANVDYASGGGNAITQKPLALTGYYRSETLSPGDQPLAKVFLTATDNITGKRDTVGKGQSVFPPSSGYAPFIIPIEDLQPGMDPDSILTIFYSSDPVNVNPFDVWSNLYLDSLHLVYPTTSTTNPQQGHNALSIYPNPANGPINLNCPACQMVVLELITMKGEVIRSESMRIPVDQWSMDTHGLATGQYLVRVQLQHGYQYQKLQIFAQ